jgi:LPXTG-motif cell wall-anchored protein
MRYRWPTQAALPITGVAARTFAVSAVVLLVVGVAAVLLGRRRRRLSGLDD